VVFAITKLLDVLSRRKAAAATGTDGLRNRNWDSRADRPTAVEARPRLQAIGAEIPNGDELTITGRLLAPL